MIEELRAGIYRIQVPLPRSPLRVLNACYIRGKERSLLVDNGFNMPECWEALMAALEELRADFNRLDYFLTHAHADHSGLTARLTDKADANGCPLVLCSAVDGSIINSLTPGSTLWPDLLRTMLPHGFTEEQVNALLLRHPAMRYCAHHPLTITPVAEGDQLRYGRYSFTVIDVKGHTPGHLALYEARERLFLAGDHILGDISPNITRWPSVPDSLGDYLHSLEKVLTLDIALTLPGHRALVWETHSRIEALFRHHRQRLDEVLEILSQNVPMQTTQVARLMSWDLIFDDWEDLPVQQQWFASGEALAHLDHLVALDRVRKEEQDGKVYFTLARIRG